MKIPEKRYYFHGDRAETVDKNYFCARCDSFVPLDHFLDFFRHAGGLEAQYDRLKYSTKNWRTARREGRLREFFRPPHAENILEIIWRGKK